MAILNEKGLARLWFRIKGGFENLEAKINDITPISEAKINEICEATIYSGEEVEL